MPKYLPTCPHCGYVVSEGQSPPERCPGCGASEFTGTTYVQDRADFRAPARGTMSPPHIVAEAERQAKPAEPEPEHRGGAF